MAWSCRFDFESAMAKQQRITLVLRVTIQTLLREIRAVLNLIQTDVEGGGGGDSARSGFGPLYLFNKRAKARVQFGIASPCPSSLSHHGNHFLTYHLLCKIITLLK